MKILKRNHAQVELLKRSYVAFNIKIIDFIMQLTTLHHVIIGLFFTF